MNQGGPHYLATIESYERLSVEATKRAAGTTSGISTCWRISVRQIKDIFSSLHRSLFKL